MNYAKKKLLIGIIKLSLLAVGGGAGAYFGVHKAPQLADHLPVSLTPSSLSAKDKRDVLATSAYFLTGAAGITLGLGIAGGLIAVVRPRRRQGKIRFSSSLRR